MADFNVVISGARGRMGRMLVQCVSAIPECHVVGEIDLGDDPASVIPGANALIDFSHHDATAALAELCATQGVALVIGTTGHMDDEKTRIRAAAERVPIVWSSNYSTGVNTLFWLTRKAAEILGAGFDLEVVEIHHRMKKDAPSGTATTLAEILAGVRKRQLAEIVRHGRQGMVGARSAEEIGMHALRGGDVVGDHTVVFAGIGERLELTHKASSRETFAQGALRAAQWAVGKPPGIYSMQDVLGLSD